MSQISHVFERHRSWLWDGVCFFQGWMAIPCSQGYQITPEYTAFVNGSTWLCHDSLSSRTRNNARRAADACGKLGFPLSLVMSMALEYVTPTFIDHYYKA